MSIEVGIPVKRESHRLSQFEALKNMMNVKNETFDRYMFGLYLLEFVLIGSAYYSFSVVKETNILIIIYGTLLLISGMIYFLYRSRLKLESRLQVLRSLFCGILIFAIFFIKIEVILSLEGNRMDLLIIGTTLLSIILLAEKVIENLNLRLLLLSACILYIFARTLVLNSPNAFNIIQIFSVGLSSLYYITKRDKMIEKPLMQKYTGWEKKSEGPWENVLRDLPDSLYILDPNLKTVWTNISKEHEVQVTLDKVEENGPATWKLDVLKIVKDLEIRGDEELAQNFFGPLYAEGTLNLDDSIGELLDDKDKDKDKDKGQQLSSKSTRLLNTSPNNYLRSSKNTETGTFGNLSFRNRSSKKLKSILQNYSLYQLIELIAKNTQAFHEYYDKSSLTITGKIVNEAASSYSYSLNLFNRSSLQDQKREVQYRTIEVKISPTCLRGQQVLILIVSDKLQGKPLGSVQSASEYKVNLLASFSHELRTPLNGNLNFLQAAIQRNDVSEELKKEYLSPALVSAKLLFYMINDILDYSQFGLNKISLSIKRIKVRTLLQEVAELFRMQAAMKNLKVHIEILEDLEIASDYTRLSQVLVSLLSNALKFTYEGSITVGICRINDAPPKCFKVFVKDTGIGLSEMQRKKVKKILKGENTEKVGSQSVGFNLGLTTAGRLATLLGPEKNKGIMVEQEKKGTKFSFVLESKAVAKNQKSLIDLTLSEIVEKPESPDDHTKRSYNRANTAFNSPVKGEEYSPIMAKKVVSSNLVEGKRADQESTNSEILMITAPDEALAERVDLYDLSNTILKLKTSNKKANTEMQNFAKRMTTRYGSMSMKESVKTGCSCNSILIVDDDSFNVLAAQKLFTALGLHCMTAFHGKQAIEIIESKNRCSDACHLFKFILMDCNMPVMDGYETTLYLKAEAMNQNLPNIPIVGCTAFVTHFDAVKCFDSGMDDYVTKPLSTEKITRILEKWNRNRSTTLGSPN